MIKNQIKALAVLVMVVSFLFVTTMPANAGGFFKRFKENYIVRLGGAKVNNPKAKVDVSKMYADAGNTANDGSSGLSLEQRRWLWIIGGTAVVALSLLTVAYLIDDWNSDDPKMGSSNTPSNIDFSMDE